MNAEAIGERLYRKVVTAVWSDDRQSYTAGCIVHGENGSVTVRFYRYEIGKGIVGRCKPTDEMSQLIKQYGRDLKAYVNRQDEIAAEYDRRSATAPPGVRFCQVEIEESAQRRRSAKSSD